MASFGKAFSSARKAGKKEFTWQGKRYNTRLAGETPSRAPTPSAAPRGSSGASRSVSGKTSSSAKATAPTPTPRPSKSSGSTMRSPRAVGGPDAFEHRAPKIVKRSPSGNSLSGGSIFGGLIKWGSKASPSVQRPYRHTRGR